MAIKRSRTIRFICLTLTLAATGVCAASAADTIAASSQAVKDKSNMAAEENIDLTRCVGLTKQEIERLQKAWKSDGPDHKPVAEEVAYVRSRISGGVNIPPEGGQHNQWYQCDHCQMHLITIDANHHKCPSCGHIYSGWPYDNVLYTGKHHNNAHIAHSAAIAWIITGEPVFRDYVKQILLGYAELYTTLPRISASSPQRPVDPDNKYLVTSGGNILNQTLNESMFTVEIASAMDLLIDGGALSQTEINKINSGLIRPMIDSICRNPRGKSNWQTWHNAAMIYAAAVLDDYSLIEKAMRDEGNGFDKQMEISVLPEGIWYENSWGYHYYTLRAMTDIAEGLRRLGGDIYTTPQLKSMYLAVFDFIMPDGGLPRFGDAVGKGNFHVDDINEPAFAAYGDSRLAAALPVKPTLNSVIYGRDTKNTPVLPAAASCVKLHSGQAILRNNAKSESSTAAILNFGPYGGFHGHYDKQSVIYYQMGKEMAVDPGRASSQAYRLPIHSQWYKSSISHNTVMIDSSDQQPVSGELLHTDFTDSYAAASTAAPGLFGQTASHDRFVMLTKEWLLIVDEIKSLDNKSHRFDWLYHNVGQKASAAGADKGTPPLPIIDHPGAAYLKNIIAKAAPKGASVDFEISPELTINATLATLGATDCTLFTADGPFESIENRVPMLDLAGNGKHIYIAALISSNQKAAIRLSKDATKRVTVHINDDEEGPSVSFPTGFISKGFLIKQ